MLFCIFRVVYLVHVYSIYNNILNIIENNVIKCMILSKNYFSNSQFVFSLPISDLLLTALRVSTRHNIIERLLTSRPNRHK